MLLVDSVLALVVLIVLAFVSTVVMHAVLRVPYVPTSARIAQQMVRMARLQGGDRVIDLGAGDGSILRAARRDCPGIEASGCEIVPTVWLYGVLLCLGTGVRLHLRSVFNEDLRNADVIFLFLMPELMQKLLPKFIAELRPGTRIITRTFPLPGQVADETTTLPWLGRNTGVFLYRWNPQTIPARSA